MALEDGVRWDKRYSQDHYIMGSGPKPFITWLLAQPFCPVTGRALDLAAGEGQTAAALAAHGMEVDAWDVSPVGLAKAASLAQRRGVGEKVHPQVADLEGLVASDHPQSSAQRYALITMLHYKQASLAPWLVQQLTPGGIVAVEIAGLANQERNPHPSARFLVGDEEIERWFAGLQQLHTSARWHGDRYLVRYVGKRA